MGIYLSSYWDHWCLPLEKFKVIWYSIWEVFVHFRISDVCFSERFEIIWYWTDENYLSSYWDHWLLFEKFKVIWYWDWWELFEFIIEITDVYFLENFLENLLVSFSQHKSLHWLSIESQRNVCDIAEISFSFFALLTNFTPIECIRTGKQLDLWHKFKLQIGSVLADFLNDTRSH